MMVAEAFLPKRGEKSKVYSRPINCLCFLCPILATLFQLHSLFSHESCPRGMNSLLVAIISHDVCILHKPWQTAIVNNFLQWDGDGFLISVDVWCLPFESGWPHGLQGSSHITNIVNECSNRERSGLNSDISGGSEWSFLSAPECHWLRNEVRRMILTFSVTHVRWRQLVLDFLRCLHILARRSVSTHQSLENAHIVTDCLLD